jgi:hypothetical protein
VANEEISITMTCKQLMLLVEQMQFQCNAMGYIDMNDSENRRRLSYVTLLSATVEYLLTMDAIE